MSWIIEVLHTWSRAHELDGEIVRKMKYRAEIPPLLRSGVGAGLGYESVGEEIEILNTERNLLKDRLNGYFQIAAILLALFNGVIALAISLLRI